jgi:NadR type nicotinamide-nucleotide adenylyltransferase
MSNARPTHGLILGKFMPLTMGHCHLIESGLRTADTLTVLVCSLTREPIDGRLRYEWVRDTFPAARVVHVTDEVPSYPHEHPDFWAIWRALIARYAPPVDLVFTSERYGDQLAAELGARHVLVDLDRRTVPISATQVRADPLAHWEYIPERVRPYFLAQLRSQGDER